MEAISFIEDQDLEGMRERVDRGTHTPTDQIFLMNAAVDLALAKLMEVALEHGDPGDVAGIVSDVFSMIILAAPGSERKQVENDLMGKHQS